MIWEYKELCTSEDLISAGGFRLAAVARTSLLGAENTAECISTAGDIEYWVNMASQAKETTKIVVSGGLHMNSLEVDGTFKLVKYGQNDNGIQVDTRFQNDFLSMWN